MSVLNIREAVREGARLVIGLAGVSGSGKTRTAIELAHGLVRGDTSKIGFLDTENRRGSLYADVLQDDKGAVKRFLIGDLDAPFSPERYRDAINEFQAAGVDVLIIDSGTHEWEGIGGCEEIAHTTGSVKFPNWKEAKRRHKEFMNTLLQSDMHIIICFRAREKVKIENVQGKTVITSLGIVPITEKNVMFEMTASLMMLNAGKQQIELKLPNELRPMLGRGDGYIGYADGVAIRDWVDGGKALDPKVEKWRNSLRTQAEKGRQHLEECISKVKAPIITALGEGFMSSVRRSADDYDKMAATNKPGGQALAELNEQLAEGDDE